MPSTQRKPPGSCQARCDPKTTPAAAASSAVIRGPLQEVQGQEGLPVGPVYRYLHPLGPVHPREPRGVLQEDEAPELQIITLRLG